MIAFVQLSQKQQSEKQKGKIELRGPETVDDQFSFHIRLAAWALPVGRKKA